MLLLWTAFVVYKNTIAHIVIIQVTRTAIAATRLVDSFSSILVHLFNVKTSLFTVVPSLKKRSRIFGHSILTFATFVVLFSIYEVRRLAFNTKILWI